MYIVLCIKLMYEERSIGQIYVEIKFLKLFGNVSYMSVNVDTELKLHI